MPYRRSADEELPGSGDLVEAATYGSDVEAELARVHLESEGIDARVFQGTQFNPLLNLAVGTRLMVREGSLRRARAVLRERPGDLPRDDGEGCDVVRCPRCELAYCFFERAAPESRGLASTMTALLSVFVFLAPKRWHCHKCGHVWSDAAEGPRQMTVLADDDPRPIFRLRRGHGLAGAFVGFVFGTLFAMALARTLGEASLLVMLAALAVGAMLGGALRYDVCSEPSCRAPLPSDRETCVRCHGDVAGLISAAPDHYSAAADYRRELVADRSVARASRERKKKRRAARPMS